MAAGAVVSRVRQDRQRSRQVEEERLELERQRYYQQQQQQQRQQVRQPAKPSVEQRLKKLEDLAQKGYITPQEYKQRKKAILDDI